MGIKEVKAKIVILSRYRDAVKALPTELYRPLQHRDEIFMAIIEALEELEDELEDLQDLED